MKIIVFIIVDFNKEIIIVFWKYEGGLLLRFEIVMFMIVRFYFVKGVGVLLDVCIVKLY